MTDTLSRALESPQLKRVFGSLLIVYGATLALFICSLFVDVPHMDEWEWITEGFLGSGWSSKHFWGFANEHREIPTWFLTMLNFKAVGLDFRLQMAVNLVIYGLMVWGVWKKVGVPSHSFVAIFLLLPFLSSINHENHLMSEQNCIHICLGAFLWGTYLIYFRQGRKFAYGICLLFLSIYSCASGIPAVVAGYLFFLMWSFRFGSKAERRASILGGIFVAIAIRIWFIGYHAPGHHPKLVYPNSVPYWEGMAQLVSLGFGFQEIASRIAGLVCFGITVSACLFGVWKVIETSNIKKNPQVPFLLSITFGILAILSSIVMGRVGFGVEAFKAHRYFEYAVFLPLLSFGILIYTRQKLVSSFLVLGAVLWGSYDDFGISPYLAVYRSRVQAKECVRGLLEAPEQNPKGLCPSSYPRPLLDRVPVAKRLQLRFARFPLAAPKGS